MGTTGDSLNLDHTDSEAIEEIVEEIKTVRGLGRIWPLRYDTFYSGFTTCAKWEYCTT